MNKLHEGKFVIWPTNFVEDLNDKNRTSKVATTRTEDGHRQNTKRSVTIYTKRTKKHRTTEEEMEGPILF